MELMGHDEFVQSLKEKVELDSLEDQLGSFPITNPGIQIWMFLSRTLFQAWLPCRRDPWGRPKTIPLALWESNYYRWSFGLLPPEGCVESRLPQISRPAASQHHIDDSALTENGFTFCGTYPKQFIGLAPIPFASKSILIV